MAGARRRVWSCILPVTRLRVRVVVGDVGDVDASAGAIDALPRVAGALEGLVDDLEQLPLRRIDRLGLEARDAKEAGVEQSRVLFDNIAAFC